MPYRPARVVVTGVGALTPIGETADQMFASLKQGRSAIGRWKRMDPRICSKVGGDLSDFDLSAHLARVGSAYPASISARALRLNHEVPLSTAMTTAVALQAHAQAGLFERGVAPERFGHVLGGHNLTFNYVHENARVFEQEPEYIEPLYAIKSWDTDVLSVSAELLDVRGPAFTVGAACASSNVAMQCGLDLIRAGRADVVLVTGAPMELSPVSVQGCAMLEAISYHSYNDAPTRASRPFDAKREGFVPSHGAAALVIESLESAMARGARIRAEVLGAATVSAASRHAKPHFESQVRAIAGALHDAGVAPKDVDYVNAHATSTPLGDAVEVAALRRVLGAHVTRIPVNATKSMLGHALTAASALELVATVLQIENSYVHPTINQEVPDPEFDLDFVPNQGREHAIGVALSNAFGFGGYNSCVVLGRPPS